MSRYVLQNVRAICNVYLNTTPVNRGLLLSSQERHKEAVTSYKRALNLRPWLVQSYLGLASALQELGHSVEARQALEMCTKHSEAPAKDGHSHSWTVITCRERLASSLLLIHSAGMFYRQSIPK